MESSQSQSVAATAAPTASSSRGQTTAAKRGSPLRLGILLLILTGCIVALGYDAWFAKPASVAANAKIQQYMDMRNQMSVKEAGPVTSADIQKELGCKPTWVENEPTHTIEWYCWWGKVPLFSTRRHYLTVLYVGEERRFSKQQLNGTPEEEDLPNYFNSTRRTAQTLQSPVNTPAPIAGGGPPPGMAPPMTMPPGMGGKGKGKGKGKGMGMGKGGAPAGAQLIDAPPGTPPADSDGSAPGAEATNEKLESDKPDEAQPSTEKTNKPAASDGDKSSSKEPAAESSPATDSKPEEKNE